MTGKIKTIGKRLGLLLASALILLPGQATAYTVGMLEILRLRSEAQAALGDDYDIREFHDVVLKHGEVPLTVLRDLVKTYILEKQSES